MVKTKNCGKIQFSVWFWSTCSLGRSHSLWSLWNHLCLSFRLLLTSKYLLFFFLFHSTKAWLHSTTRYFYKMVCTKLTDFLPRIWGGVPFFKNNFILRFHYFQHTFINNTNINNFLTNNSINNWFSASFTPSSLKVELRCYAWAEKE